MAGLNLSHFWRLHDHFGLNGGQRGVSNVAPRVWRKFGKRTVGA